MCVYEGMVQPCMCLDQLWERRQSHGDQALTVLASTRQQSQALVAGMGWHWLVTLPLHEMDY